MPRCAVIDVGTNSVLLLVAERGPEGRWGAVQERAAITRLGRGVDQARLLLEAAIEETLGVVEAFAAEARALGAGALVITATSAARDARNGAVFLEGVRARTGLVAEILSGDEEARLSFTSARADFPGPGGLVVMDLGGGSTEFIFGAPGGEVTFRQSFDVGSVRLTERFLHGDPPAPAELEALTAHLRAVLAPLPRAATGQRLVGLAGTVTTLFAVARAIDPWDARLVHGGTLTLAEVRAVVDRLAALPLARRGALPGLQPRRADVIVAGGVLLRTALELLQVDQLTVSDRGLRWGLLADRFGARP